PLPAEFRREPVVRQAAAKPKRFVSRKREELRHLRVVPEGVEEPTCGHLDSQFLAAITLAVVHLAHEQFASRLHVVRHHVHAANNFQPSFRDKPAECLCLLRITLEKRLDISDLIEREFVVRTSSGGGAPSKYWANPSPDSLRGS